MTLTNEVEKCSQNQTRTGVPLPTKQVLYQLSYPATDSISSISSL